MTLDVAEKFLTLPQCAAVLGISRIAVFNKVKTGKLRACRIGRIWLVSRPDLERLKRKQQPLQPMPRQPRPAPQPNQMSQPSVPASAQPAPQPEEAAPPPLRPISETDDALKLLGQG